MVKSGRWRSRWASRRRILPHAGWKVRIQTAFTVGPRRSSSRSRISPAALFVKVIARISFGFAPHAEIRCATRYVRTRVLPEPAPATTSSGPSVVSTASRWAGFSSSRYCSGLATAIAPMLAGQDPRLDAGESGARELGEAPAVQRDPDDGGRGGRDAREDRRDQAHRDRARTRVMDQRESAYCCALVD